METKPQNLWDAAKAVPRRKFIVTQAHLRKQTKISNKLPNLKSKGTREKQTQPSFIFEKKTKNQLLVSLIFPIVFSLYFIYFC